MSTRCTKGIILSAGIGSRLYPLTIATNKQLLPVYNKPVIYYPLTTLMLAGIKDILIICNPNDLSSLISLLGNGQQWGINIEFATQVQPNGIPEAFIIGKNFIGHDPVALILGDNIFHGSGFSAILGDVASNVQGAQLFAYQVQNPHRYGVVTLDDHGKPIDIQEKPEVPQSKYVVTGLYFYDNLITELVKQIKPSARGELEITDLNRIYINNQQAKVNLLGRGFVWFDVGTIESLANASNYIRTLEERQAICIASPEEVALRIGNINLSELELAINKLPSCSYRDYIEQLAQEFANQTLSSTNYSSLNKSTGIG